jgi:hypothetical protein
MSEVETENIESDGDAKKTVWHRCLDFRFPITIEPLVLLYTLSVGLNEVIRSNLIMDKICQVVSQ